MANIQNVALGSKITFEVYPAAQYGNNFRNVTLLAIFNAELAMQLGFDVIAEHQITYPSLPNGSTPNDPTQYSYFQIKYSSGEKQILGVPWIREGTLVVSNGKKLTVVLDDLDEVRKDRVIAAIRAQNEIPSSITFV